MGVFLAMYGDDVHIGQAIFISLFAMSIVFIILLIISYMIDITAAVINTKKKTANTQNVLKEKTVESVSEKPNTALVAVIAAAVASVMGTSIENIHITKIKRISQKSSGWANSGLIDKMN